MAPISSLQEVEERAAAKKKKTESEKVENGFRIIRQ